jgi:hypothetical protein
VVDDFGQGRGDDDKLAATGRRRSFSPHLVHAIPLKVEVPPENPAGA